MKTKILVGLGLIGLTACSVPMVPDKAEYSRFAETAPAAGTDVSVTPILMGKQSAPRCAGAGEASCFEQIEMVHTSYVVRHPKGTILVDAGLSADGKKDVAKFPFFSRQMVKYEAQGKGGLGASLKELGVHPDRVALTHVHWDHSSGLTDLAKPKVLLSAEDAQYLASFSPDGEPTVMPEHFKDVTLETFAWDGSAYANFERSHDLYGDGSVVFLPLPGHTPGSVAILVSSVRGKRLLFVGDTAWTTDAVTIPSHKLSVTSDFADLDKDRLSESLWRLHHFVKRNPDIIVVPTHDGEAYQKVLSLVTTKVPGESESAR